jgi:hypothetical protein
MPSLIYIARIKSLSEELATSLRSAGCHVKSFKPGDITQDECLLVMTSEAVGATRDPQGHRAETGRTVDVTPAALDMNEQLGSQAATWSRIKTAVTKESQAKREQVAAVASTEQPEATNLGFTPTEVGRRTVSNAQYRASGEIAPIEPSRIIAVSSAAIARTLKNIRPTKERLCRVFRNPLSTVVAVLLFSVVYRGLMLPSRKGITIPREANYDTRANSDSANSLLNVSASPGRTAHRSIPPLTLSSAEPPSQAVDRVQRNLSHDDYVAEDFTNRFGLHAQGGSTQQNPELKHPQGGSIAKRIVVD